MIAAWWMSGIIAAIGAIPIWFLVEMPGFSKSDSDDEDDEDLLPTVEEDIEGEVRENLLILSVILNVVKNLIRLKDGGPCGAYLQVL